MPAFIDLAGERFGRLLVLKRVENDRNSKARWECKCDCGRLSIVYGIALRSGDTRSCGCLQREGATTHGHAVHGARHPLYHTWRTMRRRCRNENDTAYQRYGARGITVCERWEGPDGFPNFLADVGERPAPGYHLHRINNDRGYKPGNVEWLSPSEHRRKHARSPALV